MPDIDFVRGEIARFQVLLQRRDRLKLSNPKR
jgi:hypothetical protein